MQSGRAGWITGLAAGLARTCRFPGRAVHLAAGASAGTEGGNRPAEWEAGARAVPGTVSPQNVGGPWRLVPRTAPSPPRPRGSARHRWDGSRL